MKSEVLKLNANYYPLGTVNWKKAICDCITGVAHPLDVVYEMDDNGCVNNTKIEYMASVKSFDEWVMLPVREFDDYITTANTIVRMPTVIISVNYDKIKHKKVVWPTKANIWARDNYTCQYTGKKLSKEELTVDHILPSSRGGLNSWENLVTCDKSLNIWKADRTPKECGLKLLQKPFMPKNGFAFDHLKDEWKVFIDGGTFE